MKKIIKSFQVIELDDGTTRVISGDKKQMARWYALDYFIDKAELQSNGQFVAILSDKFFFSPGFRKRK
ncbi:hypothetical protein [Streptococcus uberis]|uniref:hypothetical protein n=1 Tax=Streptococcus uberis TaxID=1349 RepID=UPI0012B5AF74|nr:hypothetical protein [Streptococcus uberis]MTB36804.1 hypothetical protein [Streptococcus uberis]MTB57786.1 hypothetical protein [Streptococcus uberis]